jgi:hypothetical protein
LVQAESGDEDHTVDADSVHRCHHLVIRGRAATVCRQSIASTRSANCAGVITIPPSTGNRCAGVRGDGMTTSTGILVGVRLMDVSAFIAAPLGGRWLAPT